MLDLDYNIHGWLSYRPTYREIDLFDRAHWGTWAIINAINQSSFNQSEDFSINQFNPKVSKYPINQVRAPWID
jgi:hypothetical protein